jgi:opacity protein-like surface antigen
MSRPAAIALAATLVTGIGVSAAGDPEWPRWYGAARLGDAVLLDTSPASGVGMSRRQQSTGFTLGVDLGPLISIEIAGDAFETNLTTDVFEDGERVRRDIGEYGIFAIVPQGRLKFPTGSWTPYLAAGIGVAVSEFNDRKKPGFGRRIRAEGTAPAIAVGAGIDYAFSEDVALGIDARYLHSPGHPVTIDGDRRRLDVHAMLATASLRLLLDASVAGMPAEVTTVGRYYLALRLGGAGILDSRIGRDLVAEPENAAIGGALNTLYGIAVGYDLTRFVGFELTADGHESIVAVRGVGAVVEYAIYTVVPQIRARYPLVRGFLVPYAVLGVGVSWAETNDKKARAIELDVHGGEDVGVAGVVGVGAEYFLTRNIAVGLEAKYQVIRGHEIGVAGRSRDVSVSAFLGSAGVRVYFGPGQR